MIAAMPMTRLPTLTTQLGLGTGSEAGLAPLSGLRQARRLHLGERAALAAGHLLYGSVRSEIRRRPQL